MFSRVKNHDVRNAHLTRRRFSQIGVAAVGLAGVGSLPLRAGAQDASEITWSTWGNPGEIERFQDYTDTFNEENPEVRAELIPVPTDYDTRLLTQLNGGTAPDVFYVGAEAMSTFIDTGAVAEFYGLMAGDASVSPPDAFAPGLWSAARPSDDAIYGVPVDCNPMVLWYNQTLLEELGVTTMPADAFAAGEWTWDAFLEICQLAVDGGRRGYAFSSWWAERYSWTTANGAYPYSEGRFVGHEDPAFVEAIQMLYDNLQSEVFTFSGNLPQGQGAETLLLSGQLAFANYGRWILPLLRDNERFTFDVVPYPTNTGNAIEPAGIPTAYISLNGASEVQDAAFTFLTNFVSEAGQTFRLSGGGNAVPSIAGEADSVVTEGELPANASIFLEAREIGFAVPVEEATVPGLVNDIAQEMDTLFLEGGDVQEVLNQIAQDANERIGA